MGKKREKERSTPVIKPDKKNEERVIYRIEYIILRCKAVTVWKLLMAVVVAAAAAVVVV